MEITTVGLDVAKQVFQVHGVDAQVRLADLLRQPLAEGVQVQLLAWLAAIFQAQRRDGFKRVLSAVLGCLFANQA